MFGQMGPLRARVSGALGERERRAMTDAGISGSPARVPECISLGQFFHQLIQGDRFAALQFLPGAKHGLYLFLGQLIRIETHIDVIEDLLGFFVREFRRGGIWLSSSSLRIGELMGPAYTRGRDAPESDPLTVPGTARWPNPLCRRALSRGPNSRHPR